ncbi:hypothetical protein PV326_007956, partial [Microctonus aethiopoides]
YNSTSSMAFRPLRQEYFQMPIITRAYTTACVLTTLAVVSIGSCVTFSTLFQPHFDSPTVSGILAIILNIENFAECLNFIYRKIIVLIHAVMETNHNIPVFWHNWF